MPTCRSVYITTLSGRPAAFTAARKRFFHESLFQRLPYASASSGAVGSLLFACSLKNAVAAVDSVTVRVPVLPVRVKVPWSWSKSATSQVAISPGRTAVSRRAFTSAARSGSQCESRAARSFGVRSPVRLRPALGNGVTVFQPASVVTNWSRRARFNAALRVLRLRLALSFDLRTSSSSPSSSS